MCLQYMRYGGRAERTFSVAANPSDGALGQKRIRPLSAQVPIHTATYVQLRNQVSATGFIYTLWLFNGPLCIRF